VLSRVTDLIITGLASAWSSITELKLGIQQTSSNPQLIQAVPPNEVVVVVSFELIMGESKGLANLCIPYNTIEPLTAKLSSNTWTSYGKKPLDARETVNLQTGLGSAAVELVVYLASSRLTAAEVANLAVGDVIVTECDAKGALEVSIEGKPKFEGFPGQFRGRKAVRIGKAIPTIEQFVDQRLAQSRAAS
jgi:flagellar motor switch protein FliM